jgi:(p)ppGpp synthase/HD superfamily hydrolase
LAKFQSAENFAKEQHSSMTRKNGTTSYYEHLAGVVSRLKNLRVTDEAVLSAAWLLDIIEDTEIKFDEIDQRFGSKVAVLVMAVSKDKSLPRLRQEEQYVKQLKESSFEAKLIKLCDISTNLRNLRNAPFSKTKKIKDVKKMIFYLNVIKYDLIKNKTQIPGVVNLINGINEVISSYGLRPIMLQ